MEVKRRALDGIATRQNAADDSGGATLGDGGPATAAKVSPSGLAVDSAPHGFWVFDEAAHPSLRENRIFIRPAINHLREPPPGIP